MDTLDVPYVAVTDTLASHATWQPNRTALVCGTERLTWRELNLSVNRVANGLLEAGLSRGDKVSVLMTNSVAMVQIILGTIKAGGVVVPLSVMLQADALAAMIDDSDSIFLFVDGAFVPVVAPLLPQLPKVRKDGCIAAGLQGDGWARYDEWARRWPDHEPPVRLNLDDDFNIIYSSGTTGVPKGIVHTHRGREQFAQLLAVDLRFDSTAVALVVTPLFSNGTWLMFLPALTTGATLVIAQGGFDPATVISLAQKEGVSHTFMVPTQYKAITQWLDATPGQGVFPFRIMVSAGAPLTKAVKEAVLRLLGTGLLELYGLTEGIATTLKPEVVRDKIASVGTPLLGGDIKIIDDAGRELPRGQAGEIVGYSTGLMRGYHKLPEKTAEVIWKDARGRTYLRSGDIGRMDEDGFLYIVDRKKDMIISGGVNVFPRDIEEVLLTHPQVADASVIGIPHDKWGEAPLGIVILKPGVATPEQEITKWVNERVAKYQRLAAVEFRSELPRNALGKVLKKELRAPYWSESGHAAPAASARETETGWPRERR